MKPNYWPMALLAAVFLISVIVVEVRRPQVAEQKEKQQVAEKQQLADLCAAVTPTQQADILRFIYKVDGGYMVYVQPIWYGLKIDEKEVIAAYMARCTLAGSA